jgi:transcriptional regulator with XRE-family HTH domain
MSYEAEVDIIRGQIGDLEDIRFRLGLSARKMAQLLMVDPSAWTRWTKKITPPPPHIYRALQWYLTLQEKNPGFTPQVFLATHWHSNQSHQRQESLNLSHQINELSAKLEALEKSSRAEVQIGFPWKIWLSFFSGIAIGGLLFVMFGQFGKM